MAGDRAVIEVTSPRLELTHQQATSLQEAGDVLSELSSKYPDLEMTAEGKDGTQYRAPLFLLASWMWSLEELGQG